MGAEEGGDLDLDLDLDRRGEAQGASYLASSSWVAAARRMFLLSDEPMAACRGEQSRGRREGRGGPGGRRRRLGLSLTTVAKSKTDSNSSPSNRRLGRHREECGWITGWITRLDNTGTARNAVG